MKILFIDVIVVPDLFGWMRAGMLANYISGKEFCKALKQLGYFFVHQPESHIILHKEKF